MQEALQSARELLAQKQQELDSRVREQERWKRARAS